MGVGPFAEGAVVQLKGTPHQWVADSEGTLHWSPDPRTIAAHAASPITSTEVAAEQLVILPRGAPWLEAPLVKAGDPIYVPVTQAGATQPSLLRVQSPADLQLFGIEGETYQAVVLDRAVWEQRQGKKVDALPHGELPAAAPSSGLPAQVWVPFTSEEGGFGVWTPPFALPPRAVERPPGAPAASALPVPPDLPVGLEDQPDEQFFPSDVHVVVFGGYFDGATALYVAGSLTLPQDARTQVELLGPDAAFEVVRAQIVKSDRVQLLDYHSVTQGTVRGREVALQTATPEDDPFAGLLGSQSIPGVPGLTALPASATLTMRVYIVGDKAFLAAVATAPAASPLGNDGMAADVARFLDSFRFLPAHAAP